MAATEPVVLVGVEDRVATVTLNWPEARNARSIRRLLQHYRQMANAGTLDDAHLIVAYMAETWQADVGQLAERRADVTTRGRSQTSGC